MFVRICVLLLVTLTCHVLGDKLKSLDEAIEILGELAGENLLIDPREQEEDNSNTSPKETDDILEKREHDDTNPLVVPHKVNAADEIDRLDTKLSAYNAFARKAHQGIVGRKGKTESDNWVFIEVPVEDDGDVQAGNTQEGNRVAAYDALRRGNNKLAAYDALRQSDRKAAAHDALAKDENKVTAHNALNRVAPHDALAKDENKVTAHDALNRVAPHDALAKDALNRVAPHDALGKDALNRVAPHDALGKVAPHKDQEGTSEDGNDVTKTKIVAFKV